MYQYGFMKYCEAHPESFYYSETLNKYILRKDATKEAKKAYRQHEWNEFKRHSFWPLPYFI